MLTFFLNLFHHFTPSFVRCVVDANTSPTWVRRAAPVSAGNPPNGCLRCSLGKEHAVKDVAEVVGFLSIWGLLWPALEPFLEYFVRDAVLSVILQPIYPWVANTI